MRTPLDPRRPSVNFTVASPSEPPPADPSRIPFLPWLVAALAWSAAAAALGWVVIGAFVSVAWLTAVHISVGDIIATIGQAWLSVHGAPALIDGVTITLIPTTLTLLAMSACGFAAHHAAGQYGDGAIGSTRAAWIAWASVTAACVAGYLIVGGVLAMIVGNVSQSGQALPGLIGIPALGAGVGALAGLRLHPLAGLPTWVQRMPRATGIGVGVLAAGAAIAVAVALVAHRDAVALLHASLEPDAAGTVLLILLQAVYLPTILAWAGSYILGAGVSLGANGVITPGVATATVLPALPVFGGVPAVASPTDWAWLIVGVLAGGTSALWVLRGSADGWLASVTHGAAAGLAPGLAWVLASWFTRGGLGVELLVDMGPRFPALLLWGTLPLAAGGAVSGLIRSLWLSRRTRRAEEGTATG